MSTEHEVGPVDELPPGEVRGVGHYAVGNADGELFAVGRRCRHLGADLGNGSIDRNGCLVCPWHGARFDVTTGQMTRGPQGFFARIPGIDAGLPTGSRRFSHCVVARSSSATARSTSARALAMATWAEFEAAAPELADSGRGTVAWHHHAGPDWRGSSRHRSASRSPTSLRRVAMGPPVCTPSAPSSRAGACSRRSPVRRPRDGIYGETRVA